MKTILVVGLAVILAAAGNGFAGNGSGNGGSNGQTGSSSMTTVATTSTVVSSAGHPAAPGHPAGSGGAPVAHHYPATVPYALPGNMNGTARVLPSLDRAEILARQAAYFNRYRLNALENRGQLEDPNQTLIQTRHHRGDEKSPRNGTDVTNKTGGSNESQTRTGSGTQTNNGRPMPATNTPPHSGRPVLNFNNSNTMSFADACRRHRDPHDCNWWRNHCTTIILIGGGFYAWDLGYWYPAYGYDPYYSNYAYDGPIYGYDGLPPDQIIANVQYALQQLGYFSEAVDGVLGPVTQAAIEDYQIENNLPVTGAIDRPLLVSLGFIR
jgi:hypothetical protein